MQAPLPTIDEPQRQRELLALGILDTPPEDRFDRLTRVAKAYFDVPIALVTLVDARRQWFKVTNRVGRDRATPRAVFLWARYSLDLGLRGARCDP